MKQHFLFMNGGISDKFTGIESAAFKRYKLFTQHLNLKPIYLCMYYDLDLQKKIKALKASGHLPENFYYVNLYEFFLRDCDTKRQVKPNMEITGTTVTWSSGGQKRLAKVYDKETRLPTFTNFYNEKAIRTRMDKYDEQGCLSISILFTEDGSARKTADYYRQDGSLAISMSYKKKNNENKINHIVVFDKNSVPCQSFYTEDQFYIYLLRYYLNSFSHQEQINLFIDRHTRFHKHLRNGSIVPKLKILDMMHSIHLENPANKESKLHNVYDYLLDLNNFDGVITLTPQQTEDIRQRFGDYGNVHCIPHPLDFLPTKSNFNRRIKHRVIAVGRLSAEKQHDKMIRIFAKVVAKIPDAQLDIYGNGSLKDKLEQQITELHLQNNIYLKGFSSNIGAEFEKAQCSLLTSKYEGFALAVLESLSYGCPVISSDICYGPASMIEEGKNGFLLPADDEEIFAERIIQVLQNSMLAEELSNNAYESAKRFSPEAIAPLWQNVLDQLKK